MKYIIPNAAVVDAVTMIHDYCTQRVCDDECVFWGGSCFWAQAELIDPPEGWSYKLYPVEALKRL